ncbi:acyl carrier protein [bacterium]|nr:acyl carrier protein [bacterium]
MKTSEFLNLLCQVLEKDDNLITLADTPDTIPEWDSLGHLSLLAFLETELNVDVSSNDFPEFASIGQLVDILKQGGFLQD